MKKEIKIIGAGPSGLTAAINLAKAGFKVEVFEKNDTVGKRFHGDYQGIENWIYNQDSLEYIRNINLEINFPYYPINQLNAIGPNLKVYPIKFERSFVYLVRRGTEKDTLDQNLYHQALRAGVKFFFNSPKDHREFGDIVAQGYFPDQVIDGLVVGYNFDTNAKTQYWIIVDDSVAPDGYGYCFIVNGKATLAVCIFRDFANGKKYLNKAEEVFRKIIDFQINDKKFFSGTSNGFLPKTAIFNNRLYIGEAGGFIDGLWGFGIKYALITGYLAAQSIIENKNYDWLWKKIILPKLKASIVNRWYYQLMTNWVYSIVLKKLENSKNPLTLLRKSFDFSLIHQIGYPWAKLFLRNKIKDRRKFRK